MFLKKKGYLRQQNKKRKMNGKKKNILSIVQILIGIIICKHSSNRRGNISDHKS